MESLWLERRKWPDVPHYGHEAFPLGEDEHGLWLELKVGNPVYRGEELLFHGQHGGLMVLPPGDSDVLVWFPQRAEFALYVDIVSHVVRTDSAITMVDLDFDVIRYADGRIELVDEDEFIEHRVEYGYPDDVAERAIASARDVLARVQGNEPPFDGAAARRWGATVGIDVVGS